MYVYVCVCVYVYALVYAQDVAISIDCHQIWYTDSKSRVSLSSKMGYVGPIETPRGHHQKNYS